ncbi:MAG TPA: hypothetical protein VNG51_04195 [Ktedonobacteraceae bacterium]|nr:hypothetical protein [Ktedonobacteraceae bacterium]
MDTFQAQSYHNDGYCWVVTVLSLVTERMTVALPGKYFRQTDACIVSSLSLL